MDHLAAKLCFGPSKKEDKSKDGKNEGRIQDDYVFDEEDFKLVRTKTRMFYPTERFMARLNEKPTEQIPEI